MCLRHITQRTVYRCACITNHALEICGYPLSKWIGWECSSNSFASGRLFKDNHVAFVKATRFSIESERGHIPVNIDGEPVQVRVGNQA